MLKSDQYRDRGQGIEADDPLEVDVIVGDVDSPGQYLAGFSSLLVASRKDRRTLLNHGFRSFAITAAQCGAGGLGQVCQLVSPRLGRCVGQPADPEIEGPGVVVLFSRFQESCSQSGKEAGGAQVGEPGDGTAWASRLPVLSTASSIWAKASAQRRTFPPSSPIASRTWPRICPLDASCGRAQPETARNAIGGAKTMARATFWERFTHGSLMSFQ